MNQESVIGKNLMQEKILNALPAKTGMSVTQLAEITGIKYHTARNHLLDLVAEGKAFVFGKDGKTLLYAANEFTKHTVIPRIKKSDGAVVTLAGGANAIIYQNTKFALSQETRELAKYPYCLTLIAHEIVKECEGIGAEPDRVENLRMLMIRLLANAEEAANYIRQWLHHDKLWDTANYIKIKNDPEYKQFANIVRQAFNIIEDREVYTQESMYSEEDLNDEGLL